MTAYLARTLRAQYFGKLSFAQSIAVYFQMLVNLGLDTLGTRQVARHPEHTKAYLDRILTIRVVVAVLAYGLLALVAALLDKDWETKQLVLYAGLSVILFALTLEWVFQGADRMHAVAGSRILQQFCYAAFVVALVAGPPDVLRVPIVRAVATAVSTVLLLALAVRRYGCPTVDLNAEGWKHILRESLPIGWSLIMITIYYNSDTIILGFLKSDEVVGWYNAAYKNIFLLLVPADTIRTALFPSLSRLNDRSALERAANGYVKTMFTIGIPIGFGGTILAPHFIEFVYGPEYLNAVLPFQILSWNVVLVFINESYGTPLLAWGKQLLYAKIVTLSAITNLVFNFLLIPPFGMIGAALATIMAEIAAFLGVYAAFQRTLRVPFLKYATRPILASIAMSIALMVTSTVVTNLFALFVVGVAVFFAALLAVGGVTPEDLRLLLRKAEG